MPNISIDAAGYRAALDYAREHGVLPAFGKGFAQLLETMTGILAPHANDTEAWKGAIGAEAPCSFWWAISTNAQRVVSGALLHRGPDDDGTGGAPNFSCDLGRALGTAPRVHEWRIDS